jgi:dimethylglycine dehydrogenase
MQSHARVVVIGGGAVGCSALYHLARLGWTDCLLLERDELTSGSTWHAAGNCPNFSTSWSIMRMQHASTQLYARLAAETGQSITYHLTGSIRLAHSKDRMDEFHHVVAMAHAQGIPFAILTPAEIKHQYPFIETHDLLGGLWDPLDGDIDPSQLTSAFAKGARDLGARIRRGARVIGLAHTTAGWRVDTATESVIADVVINAAGYRAAEVMTLVGHTLPVVSIEHQYLVTNAIPALADRATKLPLLRDPDTSWYLRQERDGLLLGPYEAAATPAWPDGIPDDFAGQLFPDDLARLAPQIDDAIARVPLLGDGGVRRVVNGPIPYSPDGNPYIGPAPGLPQFFQCCVFSFGIVQAGGAGQALAEWVVHGGAERDLWSCDPRRFGAYATKTYALARAVEIYQHEYAVAYPRDQRPAGRPALTSPLYPLLAKKGAVFGSRGGWESALWFARAGECDVPSFRRDVPSFAAVARESAAAREAAVLIDITGLGRLRVAGPDAEGWLDRTLCGRLPNVGQMAPSWLLTEKGGVDCAFTVMRLTEDRFWLLSDATAATHDRDALGHRLPGDGSVSLHNEQDGFGTLVLAGARAREVLQQLTGSELSDAAWPDGTVREITLRPTRTLVCRTGPREWELHASVGALPLLYETLDHAGATFGLCDAGLLARESLRLAAGHPAWQRELTRDTSPIAAGLAALVDFDKPEFPGRAGLHEERARGPREWLTMLRFDRPGEADAPACSPVWCGSERVGLVTSGGWDHAHGHSIALAYLRADLAHAGQRLVVEVLGKRLAASVIRQTHNTLSEMERGRAVSSA